MLVLDVVDLHGGLENYEQESVVAIGLAVVESAVLFGEDELVVVQTHIIHLTFDVNLILFEGVRWKLNLWHLILVLFRGYRLHFFLIG